MSKVLKASSVLGEISEDAQRSSEFVSFLGSDQQKVDAFQAWKSAVGDDRKEHEQALLKSLTDFLKKGVRVFLFVCFFFFLPVFQKFLF